MSSIPPAPLSPADAIVRLREGNRRFMAGEGKAYRGWQPGLVDGQWPFATILGCADSRAPAEYVFDQGLGDLFVIRVAGNIVAPSLLGSMEFAAGNFGTRLVVVLGHTQCGAVRVTVDAMTKDEQPSSRNVLSIVDRISPHVREAVVSPAEREARLANAVRANALASAREIRASSPHMRRLVESGDVVIVAAIYDVATGLVSFLDEE